WREGPGRVPGGLAEHHAVPFDGHAARGRPEHEVGAVDVVRVDRRVVLRREDHVTARRNEEGAARLDDVRAVADPERLALQIEGADAEIADLEPLPTARARIDH